jgi:hypothetical protein
VIQEETSIFWEMTVLVIVRKKVPNGYRDRAVWIWHWNPLDFCLWGWIKREAYKRKVDTRDELLARIFDAAA